MRFLKQRHIDTEPFLTAVRLSGLRPPQSPSSTGLRARLRGLLCASSPASLSLADNWLAVDVSLFSFCRAVLLALFLSTPPAQAGELRKPDALAVPKPLTTETKDALIKSRKALKGRGDLLKSELTRIGDKTIQVETFASVDGDLNLAEQILSDLQSYPKWILKGINESPDGDKYFIQFKGLKWETAKPSRIGIQFALELPVFKHAGLSFFDVKTIRDGNAFTMNAIGVPNPESVIENLSGVMHVFQAEDDPTRIWFFLTGRMKLRPWLLYEALPERLITREAGDRLQILLNNYRAEEDKRHNAKTALKPE